MKRTFGKTNFWWNALLVKRSTCLCFQSPFAGKTMEVYLPFTQSLWYKMGVLPEPGSGPSAEEMEKGFLTLTGCLVVQRVRSGHSIIIYIYTQYICLVGGDWNSRDWTGFYGIWYRYTIWFTILYSVCIYIYIYIWVNYNDLTVRPNPGNPS